MYFQPATALHAHNMMWMSPYTVKNKVCCHTKNITTYTLFQSWCDYCDIQSTSFFTVHGVNSNTEITCYEVHACRKILKKKKVMHSVTYRELFIWVFLYMPACKWRQRTHIGIWINPLFMHWLPTHIAISIIQTIGYFSIAQVLFIYSLESKIIVVLVYCVSPLCTAKSIVKTLWQKILLEAQGNSVELFTYMGPPF